MRTPDLVGSAGRGTACLCSVVMHFYNETSCDRVRFDRTVMKRSFVLAVVESDIRRKQLFEHLVGHSLVAQMLQNEAHFRVVAKAAILLVESEVCVVKVKD